MGPVEALRLALGKEIEAKQMYQKFAVEYSSAKEIFNYLMTEEEKHAKLIEQKIVELTK